MNKDALLANILGSVRLRANGRNNANNVGSCCVRFGGGVQTDATTPNNFGTCSVCFQNQSLNNFENDTMKVSVNEAKLTGFWARNYATIEQVFNLNVAFGAEKIPGLSRNGFHVRLSVVSIPLCFDTIWFSRDSFKCTWNRNIHLKCFSCSRANYTSKRSKLLCRFTAWDHIETTLSLESFRFEDEDEYEYEI